MQKQMESGIIRLLCNIGILVVNTCNFYDNRGYEKGNNILNINDAVVMING